MVPLDYEASQNHYQISQGFTTFMIPLQAFITKNSVITTLFAIATLATALYPFFLQLYKMARLQSKT